MVVSWRILLGILYLSKYTNLLAGVFTQTGVFTQHNYGKTSMLVSAPSQKLTTAQYLALEQVTDARHQYLAEDTSTLASFNFEHKLITGNIYIYLQLKLWDTYRVFTQPIIETAAQDKFYFPDIAVVSTLNCCSSSLDPTLIIEVKSSLERVNCSKQWLDYQNLASLQEYAIVSQDQFLVEVYRRHNLDQWQLEVYTVGEQLLLKSVGLKLTTEQIYEDVVF